MEMERNGGRENVRSLDWNGILALKELAHNANNKFLSDPSPIIGYAFHSLPNWLTHCCLVNLIDVTLACEDAYSELVEVVPVADVSDENRVGNS